ncbi:MAG TPA: ATPase, T2SS/T4P/T4SS family [Acidimicrobiia bacterium]|nr:ATPase, T2SS/T4P/T4SS family [Acidimicrobiia bacterium]
MSPTARTGGDELTGLAERLRVDLDARLVAAVAELEGNGPALSREDQRALAASLTRRWLSDLAGQRTADGRSPLDPSQEEGLARQVLDALFGAAVLQPYLEDPTVREVRLNGPDVGFIIRTDGSKEPLPRLVRSDGELTGLIQSLAQYASVGAGGERRFDAAHPILDMQLESGHRVWATMGVTPHPCLVIRAHDFGVLTRLVELGARGMFAPPLVDLLSACVAARFNEIIAGGTGTGKTTLLRAKCNAVNPAERMVIIEDSPELGLDLVGDRHPDQVPMCKREDNIEGVGGISMADLVRSALRGSPDRIVVGETRGQETIPLLLAMSQGNDGSMATVHARSSGDVWFRLATYAAMAPEGLSFEASAALIAGAVDLVIFLSPRPVNAPGGSPGVITSIRELTGCEAGRVTSNEVLCWRGGRLVVGAGFRPETAERLAAVGYDPARLEELERW